MSCRAIIDPAACLGHGDCVEAAPEVFHLDDDIAAAANAGTRDQLIAAAQACPTAAITVLDEETGEEIYP